MKPLYGAALALIILINVLALAGVWYNRSGTAQATLWLDQRELRDTYDGLLGRDAQRLRLVVRTLDEEWVRGERQPLAWLDEGKLQALGFESQGYWQERRVWLVLAFDDVALSARREQLERELKHAQQALAADAESESLSSRAQGLRDRLERERQSSRLLVVDAGLDEAVVRERWPKHLILPGELRPYRMDKGFQAQVELLSPYLSLDRAQLARWQAPGAELQVAFGRRHEPWVLEARRR